MSCVAKCRQQFHRQRLRLLLTGLCINQIGAAAHRQPRHRGPANSPGPINTRRRQRLQANRQLQLVAPVLSEIALTGDIGWLRNTEVGSESPQRQFPYQGIPGCSAPLLSRLITEAQPIVRPRPANRESRKYHY